MVVQLIVKLGCKTAKNSVVSVDFVAVLLLTNTMWCHSEAKHKVTQRKAPTAKAFLALVLESTRATRCSHKNNQITTKKKTKTGQTNKQQ